MNDAAPGGRKPTSVRGMLLILAATALLFAALRSGDDVAMVWAVIGGCTGLVALLRYRDLLAWRASRGLETARGRKFREALAAVGVASLVVGLSDLAFLMGFLVAWSPKGLHWRAFGGPAGVPCYVRDPSDVGWHVAMGLILAAVVAGSLRRTFWPPGAASWRRPRPYRKLWPVVVVSAAGLILLVAEDRLVADLERRRDGWLALARRQAELAAAEPDAATAARFREKMREYEYFASKSWPMEPHP